MKYTCDECDQRHTCTQICAKVQAEFEEEEVDWGETPITYNDPKGGEMRVYDPIKETDIPFFSPAERAVLSRLLAGETREEIAESLGITRDYLRKIIERLRDKRDTYSL